jgi:hypothetical protein
MTPEYVTLHVHSGHYPSGLEMYDQKVDLMILSHDRVCDYRRVLE